MLVQVQVEDRSDLDAFFEAVQAFARRIRPPFDDTMPSIDPASFGGSFGLSTVEFESPWLLTDLRDAASSNPRFHFIATSLKYFDGTWLTPK